MILHYPSSKDFFITNKTADVDAFVSCYSNYKYKYKFKYTIVNDSGAISRFVSIKI
jgi:hypothetical protein